MKFMDNKSRQIMVFRKIYIQQLHLFKSIKSKMYQFENDLIIVMNNTSISNEYIKCNVLFVLK